MSERAGGGGGGGLEVLQRIMTRDIHTYIYIWLYRVSIGLYRVYVVLLTTI